MYSWLFELDSRPAWSTTRRRRDTVGWCWDHTKYKYDSNNDGMNPTTILPPCASLPLTPATGALGAADLWCVTTTTAGLSFTGKPTKVHRPYIENLPELRVLPKQR